MRQRRCHVFFYYSMHSLSKLGLYVSPNGPWTLTVWLEVWILAAANVAWSRPQRSPNSTRFRHGPTPNKREGLTLWARPERLRCERRGPAGTAWLWGHSIGPTRPAVRRWRRFLLFWSPTPSWADPSAPGSNGREKNDGKQSVLL